MSHDDDDLDAADRLGPAPAPNPDDVDPDDVWHEDPDAPPTLVGKLEKAAADLRVLLKASTVVGVVLTILCAVVDGARGGSFDVTKGFALGAAAATLNLSMLAGGFYAAMGGRFQVTRALLGFVGSFASLVFLAFWVIFWHRAWTLGFALGLATPALSGLVYARWQKDA